MKRLWLSVIALANGACFVIALANGACFVLVTASGCCFVSAGQFERPVRLKSGDAAIRVESPGYAAPAWVDLKHNGKKQLLVGQFARGQIRVFEHLGAEKFKPGEWLKAEGKVAEVPGVW